MADDAVSRAGSAVMYDTLLVERNADGFATVLLNRPDKLNVMSIQMRKELRSAVDELQADAAIRVLILSGAGRAFTAGMDLDEWSNPEGPAAAAYLHDVVDALLRFRGPVIGAINGMAYTGGLEISLACDVLIASTDARFADTHVKVGLLPGWGGSARMVRRVGLHRAKELAFTGRVLLADEALAWGLVNQVVAPAELLARAEALARAMLAGDPATLVAYKQLLDDEASVPLAEALRQERQRSQAWNSPVSREDIDARLAALRRQRT